MSSYIKIEQVSKTYNDNIFAVKDINLEISRQEFCVIVGSSGSGKTTTLKMINRLIDPTRGKILIENKDISTLDPIRLRRQIGYVFQEIGLFPHMTISQNIAIVPKLLKWKKQKIRNRVAELLEMVHLPPKEYWNRMPSDLSGGQRQRVGFARALAAKPQIMLLDEPFGALDPITRESLRTELKEIKAKANFTAVMVTHDMTEALGLADKIVVMKGGKIIQIGTPEEIMNNPASKFVDNLVSETKRQVDIVKDILENNH